MDPGPIIAITAIVVPLSIPIIAIWTSHQRKMAEIKASMGNTSNAALAEEVRSQIAYLRQEVASLRDTTTRFDMSFDAAITRLEQRVDHIEVGNETYPVTPSAASAADRVVLNQRG